MLHGPLPTTKTCPLSRFAACRWTREVMGEKGEKATSKMKKLLNDRGEDALAELLATMCVPGALASQSPSPGVATAK